MIQTQDSGLNEKIAAWMATPFGRGARVLLGAILIGAGARIEGTVGIALALVGLVPIAAGVLDVCLVAPVLGAPFMGANAREKVCRR